MIQSPTLRKRGLILEAPKNGTILKRYKMRLMNGHEIALLQPLKLE